jgi:glycosyltransferase involved in cell wall biosynthesis
MVGFCLNKNRPFVVAAIPAYDEEKTIARVVLQAQRFVDRVIVCDDGSKDLTAEIAERLGAEVIRHERNLGYGAAIQSLFRRARELGADVMVTLDADGQHDPGEIPALLRPVLKDDMDVAVGSRFLDKESRLEDMPLYRRLGVKAITRLTGVAVNHEMSDAQHGFRAYGRKALEGLSLSEDGMGVSVEILLKAREQGLRVVEVPVRCSYRGLETSTRGPLRHGVSVVMSIMRLVVEERPLLFLGVPGVVSLVAGIMFGFWMFQIYIAEHHIVTNIALASIAFVMIGMFSIFTAITLYAITRLTRRISRE